MPSVGNVMNKFFRKVDLFPSSHLLRYNGESQYTTITGGIISAAIIIVFCILFASMGFKTLNRQIITSYVYREHEAEPSELTVTTSPEGGFMFGVFINGLNLSQPTGRLFDITLQQMYYSTGYVLASATQVPLVQCSEEHFAFTDQIKGLFHKLNLDEGLCPPIGHTFTVRGKVSSDIMAKLKIGISRCNSTLDPTCAPDAYFTAVENAFGQFPLIIPMVNPEINPNSQDYKTFSVDDINYLPFTSKLGISSLAFLEEDIIETDESIMPFTSIQTESIKHVPDPFTTSYLLTGQGQELAEINFQKAHSKATYSRSFNKMDTYFSYVGGLVGTIIAFAFILSFYNEKAYEVSLALKIFLNKDREEIKSGSFNVGIYLAMVIKPLLDFIKIEPNWPKAQQFIDSCEEISMQIDITYLTRRLIFLDAAISKLLEKRQLEALHLRQRPTIEEIKNQRRMHFAPELFKEHAKIHQDSGRPMVSSQDPKEIMVDNEYYQQDKPPNHEDYSAIEFSRRDTEIHNIGTSVRRAVREARQGNQISCNIVRDIDAFIVRGIEAESGKGKETFARMEVESINSKGVEPGQSEVGKQLR